MYKIGTSFLAFLITLSTFSQTVDTIISTTIYKSYFSYKTHTPLFVSYILYHGGGDCSRMNMSFSTNGLLQSATEQDYSKSGYDIGHLANAKDFAYDCEKEKVTFYFFNALPQTPRLNRGCWKSLETKLRKESQSDSLQIICGGYLFEKQIGNVSVSTFCFKIIKDLKTKVVRCYVFPNDYSGTYQEIEFKELIKEIPFGDLIKNDVSK